MSRGGWIFGFVAVVCGCAGNSDRGAEVPPLEIAARATPAPIQDVAPSLGGRLRSAWSQYKPCLDCSSEGSRFLFVWRDEVLVVALPSWTPVAWSPRDDVLLVRTAWADDDEFWSLVDCRNETIDEDVATRRLDLRGYTFHSWSEDGSTIVLQNFFDESLRELQVAEWLR
jgi:hypothetical protein